MTFADFWGPIRSPPPFVRVADDSPADNSSTHKSLVPPCISAALRKPILWRIVETRDFVGPTMGVKLSLATRPSIRAGRSVT
jgi:hypothetical protein